MKISLVYVTAKNKSEAKKIGKSLLEVHLVACVNIIEKVESLFWWDGKIQNEKECILLMKTKKTLVPKVIDKVKVIHSYEFPCITSVSISQGNPDFLNWIGDTTH